MKDKDAPMGGAMRISKACGLFFLIWAAFAAAASPAAAMRCGSRIIAEGDLKEKVLAECGEPSNVERWEEERYYDYDAPPPSDRYREFDRYGNAYRVKVHVNVELWTYNYGASRFMDYVRIENGRVREIYSGGYGF
jgi:hypothetical protein